MKRDVWAGMLLVAFLVAMLGGALPMALGQAAKPAGSEQAGAAVAPPASQPAEFKLSTMPAEETEKEKSPADKLEDWIKKTKNPVPWFSWGADMRVREEILENVFPLDQDLHTHENNWIRYRPRVWFTVRPMKDFELNVRAIWEPRSIFMNIPARNPPGSMTKYGWDPDYAVFDLLNFKWSKVFGLPMTITAGRQEIALGDRWLVFDGTPLDGSRSLYLDAIRLTYDLAQIRTKADLMYISQSAQVTDWFPHLSQTGKEVTDQREQGAILYLTNNSLAKTQLDGYFIYKHDQHQELWNPATKRDVRTGDDADSYTFGVRQASDLTDHWKLRDEFAGQFGDKNGQDICAFATLNRLAYFFNDKYSNELHMDYEFVSGDDPSTKGTNEAFDMLWGRWPRWSELYIYTYAMDGGVAANNNLHRLAWGWQMSPMQNMQLSLDYHLLFADENTYGGIKPGFSQSGKFRGQLLTWWLRYKFSEHLSSHVMAEVFGPGDYYTPQKNSTAAWVRWELLFSY
jgi:hypothetical protein